MKKITRKQYDPSGTETSALGLPCKTVTDYWNGTIDSDGIHIDDAFNINEIEITDGHSTGVMALAAKVAEVKLQERLVPTAFTKPVVKGYPIKTDGSVDWDGEMQEDTMTEVPLNSPISIKGIPVYKVWKGSGNVSFLQIESTAVMDGRSTMVGYQTEDADKCVYSVLSASDASAIGTLVGKTISGGVGIDAVEGYQNAETQINSKIYIAIPFNARKAMDGIIGVSVVGVGKNGGNITYWIWSAYKEYGIPISNMYKAYKEWDNMKFSFIGSQTPMLCTNGSAYINLGVNGGEGFYFKSKLMTPTNTARFYIVGTWNGSSLPSWKRNYLFYYNDSAQSIAVGQGGNTENKVSKYNIDAVDEVEFSSTTTSQGYLCVNGETLKEWVNAGDRMEVPITLFALNKGTELTKTTIQAKMGNTILGLTDKAVDMYLIPFYRDEEYGMLDLMTDTFYKNANTSGSFTYSLE